ncbi:MAG: cytochrome-c peroxidase [Deltaproteobacteria bacterium]|jgi:cytochrome c peroxidase|nr:cytochrome-c peroxidase [Deltaproteobacteria bacterium]
MAAVCLAFFFFVIGQFFVPQARSAAQPDMKKFSKVADMVRDKCMACHSRGYDLPFYASIPGIKQIIETDYRDGLRAMDLSEEFGEQVINAAVNEATLAKMEWVTLNETMPPAKFTAIHWSARVSAKERENILDWVKAARAEYHRRSLSVRPNEPVQPLPDALPVSAARADLGKKLFNDKRLSSDDTLSCAGCHDSSKAGTDNRRFAEGVRGQVGDINAPTVYNAVFNFSQFWNGRAADLAEQAGGPPFNPIEMASVDWRQIIGKLQKDEELTRAFIKEYADGWTGDNIMNAIAEYEKTLVTPNSRFDKWLKGDNKAISEEELAGYQRFVAYRCSSCHVGVSLGGKTYEYMDLKKDYFADRGGPLGSDAGRMDVTKKEEDLHKFKVPNLRNIELTWPYLHDGTVQTLNEAVHIMGIYLSGMDITPGDNDRIVAFLRTLTGEFQGKRLEGQAVPR